jgi:hypothetical protein
MANDFKIGACSAFISVISIYFIYKINIQQAYTASFIEAYRDVK